MITLGQLKEYADKHHIPDHAVIYSYIGGPDAQQWLLNKLSHGDGIVFKTKNLCPYIADIDNFDLEEIEKYVKKYGPSRQYIGLNI